jgi:hypothetical protein
VCVCVCVCENLFLLIGGSVMILVGLGLKALEMEVYGMVWYVCPYFSKLSNCCMCACAHVGVCF